MQIPVKLGDSRFDATSLHRRSYSGSPSVPSCEEVRVCPALPIRILGLPALRTWARTTCQVVQVHGRAPGGSLATLGSRSWLMFYVRTFSPQPPTSSCQKANLSVSGASPFASNVYRNHHSFNYAGKPARGRLISPWLKPGALRRNLVSDFLEVGAKIVGLVKNGLEVQGGVRIPRKERNRNDGQSILEADRVDEEVLGSVEPMDRHVVIERPRFGHGHLSRDSRRVNAAAKQVDLDQVGLALDDLALLRQVLLASRVAWALVGQAEDLDGRDQANILAFAPTDLQERLLERSVFDRLDRDDQGLGRKRLGDRDATPTPPACFLA